MGGVVSTGHDNNDLVNNLLNAEYIKTAIVERVFRAVDRADYFLEEARSNAYKDLAWKSGNLHLSAPCIYSEVMEGLALAPGLSFLNLGSGTGYLSTMVGLILGPYGVNHGIEIHEDVVYYANLKLEHFLKCSAALDEYEFCSPRFTQGNCLCLNSEFPQYDRVYCGAACPENHENYMKNLIKVGGVLVMPLNDKLLKIKRISETAWEETFLLSVSFASLISPSSGRQQSAQMMDFEPLTLQSICRSAIRSILRVNIEIENPDIKKTVRNPPKRPKKKRAVRRLVVPIFEESDVENSDPDTNLTDEEERRDRDLGRVHRSHSNSTSGRELNNILDLVFGLGRRRNEHNSDTSSTTDEPELEAQLAGSGSGSSAVAVVSDVSVNLNTIAEESQDEIAIATVSRATHLEQQKNAVAESKREKFDSGLGDEFDLLNENDRNGAEHSSDSCGMDVDSDSDADNSSTCERSQKRSPPLVPSLMRTGEKLKRIALSSHRLRTFVDSDSDSDMVVVTEEQQLSLSVPRTIYISPYTPLLRAKIQALPLPPLLKIYLNLYREF